MVLSPAPLGAPLQWLAGSAEHLAIALILGWLGLKAMRRLNASWTWPAALLAVVALARPLPGSAGWIVAVAALVAAVGGRRRQRREAPRHGAPLGGAHSPHSLRGPLSLAGTLVRLAARAWRLRAERWFSGSDLLVGYDPEARPVLCPLNGPRGGKFTLVVGATGSGKTMTESWILGRAVEAGLSAVVIDPKGDTALDRAASTAAANAGRRLIRWSPDGPSIYNPFAHGTDTEIVDRALAAERFTEPHYLRQAQRYLGHVVRALHLAGTEASLAMLARHLDPAQLEDLLRTLPEAHSRPGFAYLDSLTSRQINDLAGVRDRLAVAAESDIGRWLDPEGDGVGVAGDAGVAGMAGGGDGVAGMAGRGDGVAGEGDGARIPGAAVGTRRFDLLTALRSKAVVIFTLQSDRRPLLMQMLGAAIVLDLQSTASKLHQGPIPSIVVIDEFAAIAAGQVGALFGRARSAGMSVVLATQEISDMRLPGRESLLEQIDGNLSALVAHRQVNPDSAAWVSEHSGSRPTWATSVSSDGRWHARRSDTPPIAPSQVRSLQTGEAAVIVYDGPSQGASLARMLSIRPFRPTPRDHRR